jgi:hypothetical protein
VPKHKAMDYEIFKKIVEAKNMDIILKDFP